MESWITWIIQVVAYGIICFLLKRELNQFDQRDKRLQERIDEVEKKASADTKALAEKMDNFIQEAPFKYTLRDDFIPVSYTHLDVYKRQRLTLGVRAFGRALENGESLANTGLFRVRAADRESRRTPPCAAAAGRRGGPGGPDSGPRIKNARKPA